MELQTSQDPAIDPIYNKWLQFVKPKLQNMIKLLEKQYKEDGAEEKWIEWSISKTQTLVESDVNLIVFTEIFLKNFWKQDDNGTKRFDSKGFQKAREESIKNIIAHQGAPEGVDLTYQPSELVRRKFDMYMQLLCDSHDVLVRQPFEKNNNSK